MNLDEFNISHNGKVRSPQFPEQNCQHKSEAVALIKVRPKWWVEKTRIPTRKGSCIKKTLINKSICSCSAWIYKNLKFKCACHLSCDVLIKNFPLALSSRELVFWGKCYCLNSGVCRHFACG